jgi:O-antigen/teichoic acid export membrane protein
MAQSNSSKVFILFIANFINFATTFFTVPFLARQLSFDEYGTYGQVLLFGTFFTLVFSVGITSVSNIILADNENKGNHFFYTTLAFLLATAITGLGVFTLLGQRLNNIFNNNIFFSSIKYYYPALLLQVKQIALIVVITNIIKMALLLFCIYFLQSMPAIFTVLSVFVCFQVLLFYCCIPRNVLNIKFKLSKVILKQLWYQGMPVMVTGMLGSGILYIDGIFISNMLSVKDYAIYRNGAIEFPLVTVFVSSIAAIAMPALIKFKLEENATAMLDLKKRSSLVAAAFIFPLCIYLAFFCKEFVIIFLSEKYIESATIFSIYNLAIIVRFNNYQDLLLAYKKSAWVMYAYFFVFIISVILNYYCIKYWGLKGAVAAFLFSLYAIAAVLIKITCIAMKIEMAQYQNWAKLLKILLISSAVALLYFMLNKLIHHLAWLCFITIAYFTSVLFILIKSGLLEKCYVIQLLDKLPWRNKLMQNEIEA